MTKGDGQSKTYDPLELAVGRVELAPVTPETHQFLYYLATNRAGWRWRYRGAVPPFESFVQHLSVDVLAHFVVIDRQEFERLGYVVAYSADFRSGHVHYGAVFAPSAVGQGFGAEATLAFITYIFALWPFRKIYTELPEYTADGMTDRAESFLTLEARLKDFHYFDGRFWDQSIYSFTREGWARRREEEFVALYGLSPE